MKYLRQLGFQKSAPLESAQSVMPPDKSVPLKVYFLISQLKNVIGTQKDSLNETVLVSVQNMCLK